MITIESTQSDEAFDHFIALAQEYVVWMLAEIEKQYPELDRTAFTSEHAYDNIRQKFAEGHALPDGCLLIAKRDEQVLGCIALGRLSETICEVRTLFVRPTGRGAGAGRKLVEAVLEQARELGYTHARLDTLGFMESALKLYQSFGFTTIAPYLELSESLRQYIHFLELKLVE